MFRKTMVGLVVAVAVMLTGVETAKAEVKILTSITGAGVMPGFTVKTGVIHPVTAHYGFPAIYPAYPVAYPVYPGVYPTYPVYPAVYPTYPAYYPTPVVAPVIPLAPSYTVLYRASIYHAWTLHSTHGSHAHAISTAHGLTAVGYLAKIGY